MKYPLIMLFIFLVSSIPGLTKPLNLHLSGFSMGQLAKIHHTGNVNKIVECEVLLGRDSSEIKQDGRDDRDRVMTTFPNPWFFCAQGKDYENLVIQVGNYVVVEFTSPKSSSFLQCRGQNNLVDIGPIHRNFQGENTFTGKLPSLDFRRDTGVSIGRIVSAIRSGKHRITWEITLQEGNAGNDFMSLSVADEDLFNFSVRCLKSGKRVKVFFLERTFNNVRVGDHGLYVWKIEHLPDI